MKGFKVRSADELLVPCVVINALRTVPVLVPTVRGPSELQFDTFVEAYVRVLLSQLLRDHSTCLEWKQ